MTVTNLYPVYYDAEASSLSGVILEIGWAFLDGPKIISESHLIYPDPTWEIETSWDDQAQALHGISWEQLRREGEDAFSVARRMNEALNGRELFADSPLDIRWVKQLFDAADLDPTFHLREMLAGALIDKLAQEIGLDDGWLNNIRREVEAKYPHLHRAEPDARQWAALWLAITEEKPNC